MIHLLGLKDLEVKNLKNDRVENILQVLKSLGLVIMSGFTIKKIILYLFYGIALPGIAMNYFILKYMLKMSKNEYKINIKFCNFFLSCK